MHELPDNAIAIVGMSGRFPGARNLDEYWRNLRDGVESIRQLSDDELRQSGVSKRLLQDARYIRAASILDDADQFDAGFFGLSPRQAELMDPQHRVFLECAFEALEDAGYQPGRGQEPVGVFAAGGMSRYLIAALTDNLRLAGGDETLATYIANDKDYLATQVSFRLDLQGPSLSVQTACSSSLVAVHYAIQSLLSGECKLALAGGVTVRVPQAAGYLYQGDGIFSADGHCRAFDARATGTLFGSGAGVIVLRRVEDAVADRDRIYAVIRGSAVNNDGAKKATYTAPSVDGQAAVIAEALAVADLAPETISYVEAHGTGTPLGDPIEIAALEQAMGDVGNVQAARCAIGSVKSNIGHLEFAAGIAGLIKTALALHHAELPPSLHFEQPNPHIPFARSRFFVNARLQPWPRTNAPRRAGVSSFGIGGTNAHLVLEEAPLPAPRPADARHVPVLLPLSARSPEALRTLAEQYQRFLTRTAPAPERLIDIAYSASVRRSHHGHRLAVAGRTREELAETLAGFVRGERALTKAEADKPCKVVFVFPGQGSQWLGMGRRLLAEEPAFRAAMERCDVVIRSLVSWSPLAELGADAASSRLDELDVVQPLIFAMQVSLAALWRAWGITPDAVVGFSMGEVAAAHVTGALSLEDAARIICLRSRLALRVRGQGGMAVVGLSLEQTQAAIASEGTRLSVAASSSPALTVISGDTDAIDRVVARLTQQNVFASRIRVDFASHSHHVDGLREDLLRELRGVRPQRGRVPMYSTVSNRMITGAELDAAYWVRNLRDPVLFAPAIAHLASADQQTSFLEISPHPVLIPAIEQGIAHHGLHAHVLPSGQRDDDEARVLRESLGALYMHGHPVDLARACAPDARCVSLPRYPWQHERYWIEPGRHAGQADAADTHWLLGRRVRSPLAAHQLERVWTLDDPTFVAEHRVFGHVLVPGAAFATLILAAGSELAPATAIAIENLTLREVMPLAQGMRRSVHTILQASGPQRFGVQITSAPDDQDTWTIHAEGTLILDRAPVSVPQGIESWPGAELVRARCPHWTDGPTLRRMSHAAGFHLGPTFHWLDGVHRGQAEAFAQLRPSAPALAGEQALLGLLDACFQLLGHASFDIAEQVGEPIFIPLGIERLEVAPGYEAAMVGHSVVRGSGQPGGLITGDVWLRDAAGHAVVTARGITLRQVSQTALEQHLYSLADWVHQIEWRASRPPEAASSGAASASERWLVFADQSGVGERAVRELERRGHACTLIVHAHAAAQASHAIRLAPEDRGALASLLAQARSQPYRGVLFLWPLDAGHDAGHDTAALARVLRDMGAGLISLIQELARAPGSTRIWVATRGAQPAAGQVVAPAQAAIWGLGRVAAHEHPELWGGLIDLDPDRAEDACVSELLTTVLASSAERELAWRKGACLVPRLVRAHAAASQDSGQALAVRSHGTYLVTGGFGGLGRVITRLLLERGAGAVVLLGREAGTIEGLAGQGRILGLRADVSDPVALHAALAQIRDTLPPLRGIVHAAGTLADGTLANQDAERLMRALAGKALGAWNLHTLTAADELDFFVLFSSTASFLGRAGQGPYAAANAFLDGLAHFRRGQGRPAISVSWGPWAEVGLAAAYRETALQQGLSVLTPEQGAAAFESVLGRAPVHVAVTRATWPAYAEAAGLDTPVLAELVQPRMGQGPAQPRPELRERLSKSPHGRRQDILRAYIAELVTKLLGVRVDDATVERGLFELGMDSLRAVELKNRLQSALGCSLPATVVFAHPSIAALSTHLMATVLADEPGIRTTPELPRAQETQESQGTQETTERSAREARGAAVAMRRDRRLRGRAGEPSASGDRTS